MAARAPGKRHLYIPDTQARPGVPLDHMKWIGQAICEYRPDVVVHLGDHFDFPSLNSHEEPGSAPMEGKRFKDDLAAGNDSFAMLCAPMEKETRKGKAWNPRKIFLIGNHEDRADRVANSNPKLLGTVGSDLCELRGWERHEFLERVFVDGFCLSHFFSNTHSSRAIGGEVNSRLNKIGCSFVQGHEQGFRYGNRILANGKTIHGIVYGSAYLHVEGYRGAQGQRHHRGIIILNEVQDGDCCIMELTLNYLCRKYEGKDLFDYMAHKYKGGDWRHLQ